MTSSDVNLLKAFDNLNPSQFLNDESHMDTIIITSDGQTRCHKLVLAANCMVLRNALLNTEYLEENDLILMPDFDAEEVDNFLNIVYGKDVSEAIQYKSRDILQVCGFFQSQPRPKRGRKRKAKTVEPEKPPKETKTAVGRKSGRRRTQPAKYVEEEDDTDGQDDYEELNQSDEDFEDPRMLVEMQIKQEESFEDAKDVKEALGTLVKESETESANEAANNADISAEDILRAPQGQDRVFNCQFCSDPNDYDQRGIEKHLNEEHIVREGHKKVEGEGVKILRVSRGNLSYLFCPEDDCKWEGTTVLRLINHKISHQKVRCPHCARELVPARLKRHVEKVHGGAMDVKCELCDQLFPNKYEMKCHMKKVHDEGEFSACPKCKKVFSKKQTLNMHLPSCAPEIAPKKKYFGRRKNPLDDLDLSIVHNRPDPHRCPQEGCDHYNKNPAKIRNHYVSAHCRQKCPYCSIVLNVFSLDRHIVHYHTKDFSFVCHICSKGYHKEIELTNHIDQEHIKEVKHICEDCGKGCYSKGQYIKHKYRHHSGYRDRWNCEPCGKKYTDKKSLVKHLKRYHNGEGIYEMRRIKSKFTLVRGEEEISGPEVLPVPASGAESLEKPGDVKGGQEEAGPSSSRIMY